MHFSRYEVGGKFLRSPSHSGFNARWFLSHRCSPEVSLRGLVEAPPSRLLPPVALPLVVQYCCQCSSHHACIPAKRKEGDAAVLISLPLGIPLGCSKCHFGSHAELHGMATSGCEGSRKTAWILGSHPLTPKSGISCKTGRCEQVLGTLVSLPGTAFLS